MVNVGVRTASAASSATGKDTGNNGIIYDDGGKVHVQCKSTQFLSRIKCVYYYSSMAWIILLKYSSDLKKK